jgi:hypothetical protein
MIGKRLSLVLSFVAAGAASAQAADISGTWAITSPGIMTTCTFTQTGNFISGSCKGRGATGTAFGIVDGRQVRLAWQWVGVQRNNPGAFDFIGTLESDTTINGMVVIGYTTGMFAAEKQ